MKGISYTALGIIFGGAAGVLMYVFTGQIWWFGLVGVGLVLGAGIDNARRQGGGDLPTARLPAAAVGVWLSAPGRGSMGRRGPRWGIDGRVNPCYYISVMDISVADVT